MIIPALIPTSPADVMTACANVPQAPRIQVDVVDGKFATPASWPYQTGERNFSWEGELPSHELEIDLMVTDPFVAVKDWLSIGVKRFVIHVESTDEVALTALLKMRYSHQLAIGLSANNDVPIEVITQYVGDIDFIQLMGIATIGAQGQPFDSRVLPRIERIKRDYPEVPVTVDGSVNIETLPQLKAAGADGFVVGSAIFATPDPEAAYESMVSLETAL